MHGQCTPCLNFLPLHSGTIEVKAGTARIAVPKNRPAMRRDGRFQKGESNMVNRKCRMLFKSLCISMSVMMAATPIAPCFQAAETQTEAQTQEAAAVDNGASPEEETVASAESKEESVPASSEDKASDEEPNSETAKPQSDEPAGIGRNPDVPQTFFSWYHIKDFTG